MKPEQAQELYSEYKEGALSPALKLALEQHFEGDPAAKQDYDEFAGVFDLINLAEAGEVEAPHGFRARIMERAALESAKNAPASGPFAGLRDLFRPRRLQTAMLLTAVVGVAVVSGVVLKAGERHPEVSRGSQIPIPLPVAAQPAIDPSQPLVKSVTARVDGTGAIVHDFVLQLPRGLQSATVDAYAITSTSEIRNRDIREQQGKAVVKAAALAANEALTIPVSVDRPSPAGSTLNVVFDFHTLTYDKRAGSAEIVVFTPMNPSDSVATSIDPPASGKFFDSLQTLSSVYHVTVIADVSASPDSMEAWTPSDGIESALAHVGGPRNGVKALGGDSYFVYRRQ